MLLLHPPIACIFVLFLALADSLRSRRLHTSTASTESTGISRTVRQGERAPAYRLRKLSEDEESHGNHCGHRRCHRHRHHRCGSNAAEDTLVAPAPTVVTAASSGGASVLQRDSVLRVPAALSLAAARRILLLSSLLYGIDYPLMKTAQEYIAPDVLAAVRHLAALVFLFPLLPRCVRLMQIDATLAWRSARLGVEIGIWTGAAAVAQAFALRTTPAGKVAFISALAVVMPQLFDRCSDALAHFSQPKGNGQQDMAASTEIASRSTAPATATAHRGGGAASAATAARGAVLWALQSSFVAPLLAMMGVVVLESDAFGAQQGGGAWGDAALCLAAPVAFALSTWRTEKAGKFAPYDIDLCSIVALLVVTVMSAVCSVFTAAPLSGSGANDAASAVTLQAALAAALQQWRHAANALATDWRLSAVVLVTGFVSIGWTTRCEQQVLQVVSASDAVLLLSTEPMFAAAAAWALLGERMGPECLVAGALILLSCLWDDLVAARLRGAN